MKLTQRTNDLIDETIQALKLVGAEELLVRAMLQTIYKHGLADGIKQVNELLKERGI